MLSNPKISDAAQAIVNALPPGVDNWSLVETPGIPFSYDLYVITPGFVMPEADQLRIQTLADRMFAPPLTICFLEETPAWIIETPPQ